MGWADARIRTDPSRDPGGFKSGSAGDVILSGRGRHFLFILGPFGPFSAELARRLRGAGARCCRVLLNGGDLFDWGLAHAHGYRGARDEFAAWLVATVRREGVTDLILFGDSNPYCVDARAVASEMGLRSHVLELGYFRPNWITLERDGVNANSSLPRDPAGVRMASLTACDAASTALKPFGFAVVARTSLYHLCAYLGRPIFRHFRFPYSHPVARQMAGHVRGFAKACLTGSWQARRLKDVLEKPGPIFLVLLQRPGDSQLVRHSPYSSVSVFIETVVESFARHAPQDARLIFKAHPLDHGLERFDTVVVRAATAAGVKDRVVFVETNDLDRLLDRSTGVVTVNSTAGMAAMALGIPTIALGAAIYDLHGLTHQNGLESFWGRPEAPDADLFQRFRRVVMARTQINGGFESREGAMLAIPELARRLLA